MDIKGEKGRTPDVAVVIPLKLVYAPVDDNVINTHNVTSQKCNTKH